MYSSKNIIETAFAQSIFFSLFIQKTIAIPKLVNFVNCWKVIHPEEGNSPIGGESSGRDSEKRGKNNGGSLEDLLWAGDGGGGTRLKADGARWQINGGQ